MSILKPISKLATRFNLRNSGWLLLLLLVASVVGYQNCSNTNFAKLADAPLTSSQGSSASSTANPASTPTPVTTLTPTNTVCDPFNNPGNNSNACNSNTPTGPNAFVGALFVEPRAMLSPGHHCSADIFPVGVMNVNSYISQPTWNTGLQVVMSQLNIPGQTFSNGFTTASGSLLTVTNPATGQAETLDEFFAISFSGVFQLAANDPPGNYQFAVASDDGSTVMYSLDDSQPLKTLITDQKPTAGIVQGPTDCLPGSQAMRMGCYATLGDPTTIQSIAMSSTTKVRLQINWFQGPRNGLGLQFFYRKVPAAGPADSNCESENGGDYVPTLKPGGWNLVTSNNLAPAFTLVHP